MAAVVEYRRATRAGRSLQLQMPGNPDLVAEGRVVLSGFRTYLDGPRLVTRVDHFLDSGGYRCSVVCEPPE